MSSPTPRQLDILRLLEARRDRGEPPPSYREIGEHLGLPNVSAVAKHIDALRRLGRLTTRAGKTRSIALQAPQTLRPSGPRRRGAASGEWRGATARGPQMVTIPIVGSIPAGLPGDRTQDAEGCVSVDLESVGIRPTTRTFALRISGDSMIGRHIVDGDVVIVEHGREPRTGDVVAALIDGQSTLKTFVLQRGRPYLRAENPKYPDLIPAGELVIQGVLVALIRKKA